MCKAFIFGKKLLLTIRCTTHFNDANTFIATQRVKEPTVYVQSQYNFSIMSYTGLQIRIHENPILPKKDKVKTDTSWCQFLMALDVVSGKYHILTSVLK